MWRAAYEEESSLSELEDLVDKLYGPQGTLTMELEKTPYMDWLDKEKKNMKSEQFYYKRYETVKKLLNATIEKEEIGAQKQEF
mmetsp:Transcript_18259/g.28077  ORF Transcript_18259/g.28077 Transcript_18259/m.28077 type:complete len:83 (+) Transcript_18259:176-424(+)